MSDTTTRINRGSVKDYGNGCWGFEIEQVPAEQATQEALAEASRQLAEMYARDPSSFRWTKLSIGPSGATTKTVL